MTNLTPTPRERAFLRAIAAVNPNRPPGEECWWSARDLRHTPLFPDFRFLSVLQVAGLGKSCTRKGMAVSRHIGTRGHGWTEWRISSYGRGLVSDSCIGGGLPWDTTGPYPVAACPACRVSSARLSVILQAELSPAEVPAHPLPGYRPDQTTAAGETR